MNRSKCVLFRWTACLWFLGALISALAAEEIVDLGTLDFPNSGSEEAQESFIRGVLLLHSFEFEDAAEAFQEAQAVDPDFALAYWGEAMTHNHPLWRQQNRDAALKVLQRFGATSDERMAKIASKRERDYLATLDVLYGEGSKLGRDRAYEQAMRRLSERYPDDLEAKAFYALSILGTTQGERDFRAFMRAGAIAEEVFAANPRHPGAVHYLIHSYDDPVHAPLGLRAARVYADIAPAASHAQHMISHIYVALGRWAESIDANVKSFAVSVKRAQRKGLGVDARNFHSLHWLQYSRLQLGQFAEAERLLAEMDRYANESGSGRTRWYQQAFRAGWVVETGADSLPDGPDATALEFREGVMAEFAAGWAALQRGEAARAEQAVQAIAGRLAESAEDDEVFDSDRAEVEVLMLELAGRVAMQNGSVDEGLESLGRATGIERDLPLEYGPPDIIKPSFELLGDVLLDLGRAAEAKEAYETALERAPRRRLSLLGLARALAELGETDALDTACGELNAIYVHADEGLVAPAACTADSP